MNGDSTGTDGVVGVVRRCLELIGADRRSRWVLVLLLALGVSTLEVVAAVLVLFLLRLVTAPEDGPVLPLIGDLRSRFPDVSDEHLFVGISAFLGVFFLFRAACVLLQTYVQNRVAYSAGVTLSERLVRNYFGMAYTLHQQRNSAELIRNAYASVDQIVAYAFIPLVALASESLVVAGILVVLLVTAPLATAMAALLLGPLVLVLVRGVQPRLGRLGERSQEASKATLQTLTQSLEGIRELTLLGRRGFFLRRFVAARRDFARAQYTRAVFLDLPRLSVEAATMLFIVGFLAISRLGGSAERTLPVLGLFAYAVLRLMPALNRIVTNLNTLRFSAAAVGQVHDDLTRLRGNVGTSESADVPPLPFTREIALTGVSYRYPGGDRDVLEDLTLTIRRGESIGVVGPTGGGKSTLLDVLLGLITPTAGRVLVDGVDVRDVAAAWHRQLGVVPQTVFLLDDSLRRNIAFGLDDEDIDEDAVRAAVSAAQLGDVLDVATEGLDAIVGERGVRLSGGQRQRVAIARALYRRPAVLVLDEGTAALDNVTEAALMKALELLKGERTIVMVAHRLTTVRDCNRIIVLDGGRIVDEGRYDDLVARNASFRLTGA